MNVSNYINKIAPEHERTSCTDENIYNSAYGVEDHYGHGRCYRCCLIAAQRSADETDALNTVDEEE